MRNDHRPYRAKQLFAWLERYYLWRWLAPQADAFGEHPMVLKPWHVHLHGKRIRIGAQIHIIAAPDRPVALTTWAFGEQQGAINIADFCLLCPGVRIDSAERVDIGNNCMLAAGAYITDADWHDLYDRAQPVGATGAVVLADNVWLGDGAMICKGVTIGQNSIVGARAVVTRDVPENCIVGGNPARIIKQLDPEHATHTRAELLADPQRLAAEMAQVDRYLLSGNGWLNWLRTLLAPQRKD